MTQNQFAHATMLVASLRTRLGHANALTAAVTAERDDLAKQLAAHVESLKLSNTQCAEYLQQNEQLHSELVKVRSALASVTEQRDSLRRTLDEWERADTKPHARIDEVAQTVPVCMQCLKERIKTAHAYETGPAVAILTKPLLPADVADHVVPPVLPMCTTCHGCGGPIIYGTVVGSPSVLHCRNEHCLRRNTAWRDDISPYHGPCKSSTPVRHE